MTNDQITMLQNRLSNISNTLEEMSTRSFRLDAVPGFEDDNIPQGELKYLNNAIREFARSLNPVMDSVDECNELLWKIMETIDSIEDAYY